MKADLRCELSWSVSRAAEYERCPRESWWARYASWGWWQERPRGRRYEAMLHKNLVSLPAFTGTCLHEAVERWFARRREGQAWDGARLFEEARDRFRAGWRCSHSGDWRQRPNKKVHLAAHHYGEAIPAPSTERLRDRLERCAHHFAEATALAPARAAPPETWFGVEALDSFELEDTRIYAVPDFGYQEGDTTHVWDWKTGVPREADAFQLRTYALYAIARWDADPERIALHVAYLDDGTVRDVPFGPDELLATREAVGQSLQALKQVHYDPDHEQTDLSTWPAKGAPEACPSCRFRGLCDAAAC